MRIKKIRRFVKRHPKTSFLSLLAFVTVLCMVASILIDTRGEKVVRTINRARKALERGDVEGIMKCVAADFRQEGMDRAGLSEYVREGLERVGPPRVTILSQQFIWGRETVACTLSIRSSFPRLRGTHSGFAQSHWRVRLRRTIGQWYITEVTPLDIEGTPQKGLQELRTKYLRRELGLPREQ